MSMFGLPNVEKMKKRGDVRGLIHALSHRGEKDRDYEIRRDAHQALVLLGPVAVQPLIAELDILKEKQPKICADVARILADIGDPRAVDAIVMLLMDIPVRHTPENVSEQDAMRQIFSSIAASAGRFGDAIVLPLTPAFSHPLAGVREAACMAIGAAANAAGQLGVLTEMPLRSALRDPNAAVRQVAAAALSRLNWTSGDVGEQAWYSFARQDWKKCVELGSAALEPLHFGLGNFDDEYIQVKSVQCLGQIKDPGSLHELRMILVRDHTAMISGQTRISFGLKQAILAATGGMP